MLSLLSRIVIGSSNNNDEFQKKEILQEDAGSGDSSSSNADDTDEEVISSPMPTINIDQTELAEEAIHAAQNQDIRSRTPFSDISDASRSHTPLSDLSDLNEDSAIEKEPEAAVPVEIPSQDVCRRIVELIEYYLSDENLVKDMFLLKHVTKHHEGFVSLKLLTSYKKVKKLTKDWRVVAHSLKSSKTLELNDEEMKVKRRNALPQELEEDTRPFRTILATNILPETANMNKLAEFFGKFGEMISLQLHKPGGRTLEEVRQAEREHPGISASICAMVEYEKVHFARQALRYIINNPDCNMKGIEVPRKKREATHSKLEIKRNENAESCYYSASDLSEPASPICPIRMVNKHRLASNSSMTSSPSVSPIVKRRLGKVFHQSSPESSPPSPYMSRHGPPTPSSSPEEQPMSSLHEAYFYPRYDIPSSNPLPRRQLLPQSMAFDSPKLKRRGNNNKNTMSSDNGMGPTSPWLRRRFNNNNSSAASTPNASPSLPRRHHHHHHDSQMFLLPDNVTRFPRGPDGTRGFTLRRSLVLAQA